MALVKLILQFITFFAKILQFITNNKVTKLLTCAVPLDLPGNAGDS
jgi:hypothetical protein